MSAKKKIGSPPSSMPWSVKGVSPETREAVRKAARRSNQTIGQWMDEQLRHAATESLQRQLPAQRMEDQLAEISAKLDGLSQPLWKRVFGRGRG